MGTSALSMQYSYASAGGGFGLLLSSDWAVICSAKLRRSYMLADFITRYINKLILLFIIKWERTGRVPQHHQSFHKPALLFCTLKQTHQKTNRFHRRDSRVVSGLTSSFLDPISTTRFPWNWSSRVQLFNTG